MNIYIPYLAPKDANRRELFMLTRPFWSDNGWEDNPKLKESKQVDSIYRYTDTIEDADVYFIPKQINKYSKNDLNEINVICKTNKIRAYGYIAGDLGTDFGCYSNIYFLRSGGFKSQLNDRNIGFVVANLDTYKRIYKKDEIDLRAKNAKPTISFCGHANFSLLKMFREFLYLIKVNFKRFFESPLRQNYEPLFAAAYTRAKLLRIVEKSNLVNSNFIYRKQYRAGVKNRDERIKTEAEFHDNIKDSDYVVCVRGGGNFSVRFYQTLMMGRIPIFVNTDCLLPFEDEIDWKKHVVWVEWKDRNKIVEHVLDFHNSLTEEEFKSIQLSNRHLWKHSLSLNSMLTFIKKQVEKNTNLS